MRFEYTDVVETIVTVGHNKKVYSERVDAGWLLKVVCYYMYVPDIATQHHLAILVEKGAQDLYVRWRGKEVGRVGISTLSPFLVGEYQCVVGYAPDAEIGDKLKLTLFGELTPLFVWRGLTERGV